jgi:hypothetical protein
MEWTDQDIIYAQNIPKKAISYWMKYSIDFPAQKIGSAKRGCLGRDC